MNFLNKLKELISEGDQLSHTKVWSNVGYFAGTWAMVKVTLAGNLTPDLLGVYLAIVAAHCAVSKWIGQGQQK